MKRLSVLILFVLFCASAQAQSELIQPDITPAMEMEARDIGKSLRCVVCQNQSIEESDADLAADMRRLVRERLAEGDSREDVMSFMTDRYGDYVLLRPRMNVGTYALWFGPFILLAFMTFFIARRRTAKTHVRALETDEQEKLAALRRALHEDRP